MFSREKMKCLECGFNNSCPSYTRAFVNYCGSMPGSLKEQIFRARIDCRNRRGQENYRTLHFVKSDGFGGAPPTESGASCVVGEKLLAPHYN